MQGTGRAGHVDADGGRWCPDSGPCALQKLGSAVLALLSGRPWARPCLRKCPGLDRTRRSHRKLTAKQRQLGRRGDGQRWTEGREQPPGRESRGHVLSRRPHGRV